MRSRSKGLVLVLGLLFGSAGATVAAEGASAPSVVASIPPLAAIAAAVMGERGAPELLVPPGASPHGHALKPSEVRRLAEADLVVWAGAGLEPWLERPLAALAEQTERLTLLDLPGLERLPQRETALWEDVTGGDATHDHHNHFGDDPHAWLDPRNGALLAKALAERLGALDPAGAAVYRANAATLEARLTALETSIRERLAPLAGHRWIVFHDAYQYFEHRFGVRALGAVTLSPETQPGAGHVVALRQRIEAGDIACVFAEPQFPPRLIERLTEGATTRGAVLDPLGTGFGAEDYPRLIEGLAEGLAGCLKRSGG